MVVEDNPKPNKSLGQHWLYDETTLVAICDSAQISKQDTVLEVGPGTGSLTAKLCERAGKVVAVEFDDSLAERLHNKQIARNLQIVNQDILKFDLTSLPVGYKVVANIPYYLTSKLIRVISESTNPPETCVLLVQKEVARRVAAKPGDMSLLSVSAQYYWQVELGLEVPAKLFVPPPKVDSQVVILTRRKEPLFAGLDEKLFFQAVKAGFSSRRKTLLNSLSGGLRISKNPTLELLAGADINPNDRAQNLSLEQWSAIAIRLAKNLKK
jgi:16S rRNA (adenine1518-N6/adenine1519-N6)-dimethyltransferase